MKYLVNRETKEHVKKGLAPLWLDESPDWKLVEADEEGWIPWRGGECPLPDGVSVSFRYGDRTTGGHRKPEYLRWSSSGMAGDIVAYRPILSETSEKVENYTAGLPHSAFWKTEQSVFDRLKSSIAASESIPSIIAEIDALLPEGYCVTKREAEQRAEDMSDWKKWSTGDLLEVVRPKQGYLTLKGHYTMADREYGYVCVDKDDSGEEGRFDHDRFRFHSRPAKVAE